VDISAYPIMKKRRMTEKQATFKGDVSQSEP